MTISSATPIRAAPWCPPPSPWAKRWGPI
ncbi:hypothetical protein R2601_04238 [Salipiger bermudensis HTCC2601]|uniref:Uncharacterized protein n=1 Tax=Salipiger bermudensis (strain DSM 26914 / JCM 13377 / KCTC 12554 / HTCC2601) TaxID=314265 RepID=Q0FVZ8_SALBH|nr:hypothetical protein R2601_04238 [Salipiger bermudensis HTCC2601]